MSTINLAIYVRVSTQEQTYSRQVELIQNYISSQYKDIEINIDIYSEKISGFKTANKRPELTRLQSAIEADPSYYKCIYVTELSRIGRNPNEARVIVTSILERGIDVCVTSTNGGSHFLNPDGTINDVQFAVLGLLMDFAKIEISIFKQRTATGLRSKIMKGGSAGGILQPFGYTKDENKKLVIDVEEAKTIEYIFQQYSEGAGMGQIANELNKNKIQTRTNKALEGKTFKGREVEYIKWTSNQIYTILTNTIYCGVRIFRRRPKKKDESNKDPLEPPEPFDAPDVAIVSKELFDKCTEIRENKKGNGRNIDTKNVILLQYLTTCGVCGRNYTHRVLKQNQTYICSSRVVNGFKGCENLGVSIDLVDSSIYDILCKTPTVLQYLNDTASIKIDLESKIKTLESSIPSLEKELKTNEIKIDRLLDAKLNEEVKPQRFKIKNDELEATSENLIIQLETKQKQLESYRKSIANLTGARLDNKILIDAKNDRNKLKSIYNQIIKNVKITAINFQFIRLDITLQINGQELDGTLRVVVDRKGVRKKPFQYRYQDKYLEVHDPSEVADEDYYEYLTDNSEYDYKNLAEYNSIIKDFKIISDNIINIYQ